MGGDVYKTTIDAALVEMRLADVLAVRRAARFDTEFLAVGVGSTPTLDKPVSLRRPGGALQCALKVHWSGYVDIPDLTKGYPDYFLANAVGYLASTRTAPGDSGAPLWDANEYLMGMHIGGVEQSRSGGANAVMGLIEPVLEWFAVQPYLRNDPATLPDTGTEPHDRRQRSDTVAAAAAGSDEEVSVVARTLWGEARGEGEEGMQAVACVIGNRLRRKHRGRQNAVQVCLDPLQFSCWNASDANRSKLEQISRDPDSAYLMACAIARDLLSGRLADITNGATHYLATTLRNRPLWVRGKTPCKLIGKHEFYNNID